MLGQTGCTFVHASSTALTVRRRMELLMTIGRNPGFCFLLSANRVSPWSISGGGEPCGLAPV